MEHEVVGLIIEHVWTMSCAVVGSFIICCAYWFAVPPGQRAVWLPLVLVLLTVTTALVISVIKGSIALSLGLIGALSVARFRTRINDPRQLALVLVAIAMGIGFGSGELLLTGVGTLFIAGLIVVFHSPPLPVLSKPAAPWIVAQLSFTGDEPVSIEALSDYLRTRQVAFGIRSMTRTANVTTATVHLHDYALSQADQLTRDMADVFPAHQCDCQLQVKSVADPESSNDRRQDADERSRDAAMGADVPASVFGKSFR